MQYMCLRGRAKRNGQSDELSGAEMGQLEHLGLGDSGGREFGSLDTYIEETLGVSQELERMRHSDTIISASVTYLKS